MTATAYTIGPARYATGQMIVQCAPDGAFKSRAARLIGDGLRCRYSKRCRGYIASPSKAKRFEALYTAGYDASVLTGEVYLPHR